MDMSRTKLQSR